MKIKPNLVIAFQDGVKQFFKEIADEYSCSIKQINELTYYLKHNNYFVKIEFFKSHEPAIHITIHPDRKIYKRLGEDWHGLGFIASVLAPDSDFGPIKFKKEKDVLLSLEKQAQILVECCDKMLKGDFSQWRKLNIMLRERVEIAERKRFERLSKL